MPRPTPQTPELSTDSQASAAYAVRVLRMHWFGFLTAMLAIFFGGALAAVQQMVQVDVSVKKLLFNLMVLSLPGGSMIGFIIRMQTYKRGYVIDRVTPQAYVKANQILYGIFLTITLIMGVTLAATLAFSQCLLMLIVILVLHALNFPNGKPLQPAPPALLNS